jgi:hypothetical protein
VYTASGWWWWWCKIRTTLIDTIQLNVFTISKTLLPATSRPSRHRVTCIHLTRQIKVINHKHLIRNQTAPAAPPSRYRTTLHYSQHHHHHTNNNNNPPSASPTVPTQTQPCEKEKKKCHEMPKRRHATRTKTPEQDMKEACLRRSRRVCEDEARKKNEGVG